MIRNIPRDAWVGLVVFALAVIYWIGADGIRSSSLEGGVGAAGLPKAYAWILGALALILVVRAFLVARQPEAAPSADFDVSANEAETGGRPALWRHMRAAGMLAIGVGYLLIVPHLGYLLSVMVLMAAVALYNGARPTLRFVATIVLGGIFYYVLFVRLLGIPLPPGMWPAVLSGLTG